jgi:surfeit locus 1 family protein
MLRAGFWQLERADEKRDILQSQRAVAHSPPVELRPETSLTRFQPVKVVGEYASDLNLFLDNQVVNTRVGYRVFTPFKIAQTNKWVLVDRGWVSVGENRSTLPTVKAEQGQLTLLGRLNKPPVAPPLWNDDYPVSSGQVWQYLPIPVIADQLQLDLLSMVVELRPSQTGETTAGLIRQWPEIDDKWVARHNAYAFQWFAMAFTLFIASLILIFLGIKRRST